jgi:hypothetical protein
MRPIVGAVVSIRRKEAPIAGGGRLIAGNLGWLIVTNFLGNGFLGNHFAGLQARATLVDAQAAEPLPPAVKTIKLSPQAKYLKFAYSPTKGLVYATGENVIAVCAPMAGSDKVVTVVCPDVTGALVVDDTAGFLYAAKKDGDIAVRALDANGIPAATGTDVHSSLQAVEVLCVSPATHIVYALGMPTVHTGPVAGAVTLPAGKLVSVQALPGFNAAIVDSEHNRLYAGSSYNANQNVWVWQLAADGLSVNVHWKRYGDGLPTQDAIKPRRGMIGAMRLDSRRHKLYLAASLEAAKPGEAGITVYDLDAAGDPTDKFRFTPMPTKSNNVQSLDIAPDGKSLYAGGAGDPRVFIYPLNAAGDLAGEPAAWPIDTNGKAQLTRAENALLCGTHPSLLEIVPIGTDHRTGQEHYAAGLPAALGIDRSTLQLGVLQVGIPSAWQNMDDSLKGANGTALARLTLKGAPVTAATIKLETALLENGEPKPLKTVTSQIEGPTAAFFLPRYGLDDLALLPSLVQSSGDRYRQYLSYAQKYAVAPEDRPRKFIVANGLIGLDSSREALEAGAQTLGLLGHNTAQIWNWPGIAPATIHATAKRNGIDRFRLAVYNPPSYFDFNTALVKPESLDAWAAKFKDSLAAMGAQPQELALMHMGDEPGWYFPRILDQIKATPDSLSVFRDYLKSKGMTPELLGKTKWEEVEPIGLSAVHTLPDKRLLFWTARFCTESLSRAFGAATAALQRQLNSQLLTTTNLNNWPGRFFIPSPGVKIANNSDKGPDAGMGMPDWFDLGRKKAISCIWTEDWFGDSSAENWSMYADLLRCAAREGPIEFGGYVVGHPLGGMADGGKYKVMALTGHGAKALDPYIFGPNPAFADGWSEKEYVYRALAGGLRMLGKSEKLLYPGRPRAGTVAILFPQASQVWDPDSKPRYYMQELYGLHAALIHAGYPVDFVDDFGVEDGDLQKYHYSVLYVTAPNLSVKAQQATLDFAKAGGTVVLLPGAAAADEYNEPTDLLWQASGAQRQPVARDPVPGGLTLLNGIPMIMTATDQRLGVKMLDTKMQIAPLKPLTAKSLADFSALFGGENSGKAALVAATLEQGRVLSFGYWPGLTYWNSPDRSQGNQLPQNWSADQRRMIVAAARFAGARKHVDVSVEEIEGALLESDQGIAVTLLNWTSKPQQAITVTIPDAGKVTRVESVEQGALKYQETADGLQVTLPLDSVDVLMLTR